MIVTVLCPEAGERPLAELLEGLAAAEADRLVPFDPETVTFGRILSERLFADSATRAFPELAALAYALRPAATARLHRRFGALEDDGVLRLPRGLAYHVAPANVATLFVHSWWLSALCGNRAVVRVSSRTGEAAAIVLRLMGEILSDPAFARLGRATAMIHHPRDPAIAAALSLAADIRIVWGGDAAIRAMRALPLRPDAVELAFPDRHSLAVIDTAAYLGLDVAGRDDVADRLARDAYGFDQLACSSPLLLAWVGDGAAARRAGGDFWPRVAESARRRGHVVSEGAATARLAEAARLCLDGAADRISRHGAEVVVAGGTPLGVRPGGIGGGLFQERAVASLDDLAGLVDRRVQTIGHFGFEAASLRALVRRLNGRGGDRLVPLGDALDFSTPWDGHDLFAAMTRAVGVIVRESKGSVRGLY